MARKPRVQVTFRDVLLLGTSGEPVEFAHLQTDQLGITFHLRHAPRGWYVWATSSVDREPEVLHEEPFASGAEAHHRGCEVVIESIPKFVRVLTRRIDRQEGRDGD